LPNDALKNLRAEVRKRRNAVTAKENRIKRNTGVDIRNTSQDPRRPVGVVERYNRQQLTKYLSELNSFMSRSVGYVAGAGNAPIPKADWLAYKKLEKQYNAIGEAHFSEFKDLALPMNDGLTVAEREKLMVPTDKRMQGEVIHRPYSPLDRDASRVKGVEGLKKLTEGIKKKLNSNFLPSQIAAGRKQLEQMLTAIGNGDTVKDARKLTDFQFNILWNYTDFATTVARVSPSGSNRSKAVRNMESSDRYSAGVIEDYEHDIREFFNWASTLAEPRSEASAKRSKTRKTRKARKAK